MRVAVVGGCASGKSTVASALQASGFDAYVVGQEHSAIRDLWKRRSPDVLVYLHASLEAVRARRGRSWPEWLYHRQVQRLADAREHADIVVDTGAESESATIAQVLDAISVMRQADS